MKKEKISEIIIDNEVLPVFLIRKFRQKNCYFRFKNKEFIITANISTPEYYLLDYLNKVKYKLYKKEEVKKELDEVYILGEKYYLKELGFEGLDEKEIFKRLGKKYYSLILGRIRYYENLMGITNPYNFKFHYTNRNFGSNSRKTHTIYLSFKLLQYDLHLIDSVIVHELAHHYYFDHSPKFYDLIYKYYEDYDISRKKLIKRVYK